MFCSSRTILILAAGAAWLVLGATWSPLLWVGLAHNAALFALCCLDWRMLRECSQFSVQREVKDVLSLGTPNVVRLTIGSEASRPFRLQVRDEPPFDFAVDRRRFELEAQAGSTTVLTYHITPPHRGRDEFGAVNVRFQTSLGLVGRQRAFALSQAVRVYPDFLQTQEHQLLARRNRLMQMGLRVMRLHGRGMEFERLRDYVPDDDLRKVDWKASARRAGLVTREYDVERSQSLLLLLDCGRTMASKPPPPPPRSGAAPSPLLTKLDYAINACMLLTYVAAQSDDRVGLFVFADEIERYLPPGKGHNQLLRMTETLAGLQPRLTESNYRAAFHGAAQRLRKRSLAIVFTDLIDADSSERLIVCIRSLLRKHLVLCVALSDYELPELIARAPQSTDHLYQQTVAIAILQDRRRAIKALQGQGVIVLDATPKDLTVAVVNKYLEIKREGRV